MNINDEAKQTVLDALADLPSGPPPAEVLNVLLAQAWDEGHEEGWLNHESGLTESQGRKRNPYRPAGTGE